MSIIAAAGSVLAMLAAAFQVAGPAPSHPSHPSHPSYLSQQPPVVKPVNIVVLVDESTSLSPADIEREREAASLIAQGEFAPGSVISVVGFGSENEPGQSPVDVVCPPTTVATAQDGQFRSECVAALHRRTPAEGNGTDHAAALGQALSYLVGADAAGEPKMIFLLTDGVLDVSDSPRYGKDNVNDRRNKAARAQIETHLSTARRNDVQLWPLGFGTVDRAQLDRFAAGGSPGSCGSGSPSPRAVLAATSDEVVQHMLLAFSAARCAGIGPINTDRVPPGGTISVVVTIPPIATDGSIIVFKRDPRIGVRYLDPAGTAVPKSGSANESTFTVSGENGPVEALRIVNPVSGDWTVRITSPDGVAPREVGTTVLYQGAVRASLGTDPPSPKAGQPMAVWLRLATRNRTIDPATVRQLRLSAEVSGEGFSAFPVGEFVDDGTGADVSAADGVFTSQVTVPAGATGPLRVAGQVTGVGISGDFPELNTRIEHARSAVRATVQLPGPATEVAPGGSVPGSVEVTNESGRPRSVRLLVTDPGPGTRLSIPDAVHPLAAAGSSSFDFTLALDRSTALGTNTATLQVVDDADPALVFHSRPVTLVAAYPFPWLPVLGAIALAVIAIIATVARAVHRRAVDVRGLVVKLYRGSEELGDLAAPEQPASCFCFLLRLAQRVPELLPPDRSDAEAYQVSRPGRVPHVRPPGGGGTSLPPGHRLAVTPDLSIELIDEDELAHATRNHADGGSNDRETRALDDRGLL